jgi:hypothetical protein
MNDVANTSWLCLREEIYSNAAALHIIKLCDQNIMISFAPHPSEQQINQHKKNLKILAHYKKCYPDLYTKVGRFLHPGKTIEMGSEEEVY